MLPDAAPLILTASDRLARALREDHSLAQRASGRAVWEAPRIQTLRQWLLDTWAGTWPAGQLLHPVQELALWREAIESDEQQSVLAPLVAAREARRTEQIAILHGIDLSRTTAWREEHQAFQRWQSAVQKRRGREHWLIGAELARETAALIRQRRVELPPAIRLAGFLNPLPAGQRVVLEALSTAGVDVATLPFQSRAQAAPRRWRYPDAEAQFRSIGRAIRDRLQAYAGHDRPPPRIVVAMPDPDARRELIENLFRPLLAPWLLQAEGARALPWRWERGRPLADQPWIDTALAAAAFEAAGTAPEIASRLLLSSALWNDGERALTAQADYTLRESGVPLIRPGRLLEATPAPLRERIAAFTRLLHAAPRQALPSAWAEHWQARLDALGWPGSAALDSVGFQAVREWGQLLARLSSMDGQLGRLSAGAARGWLGELARSTRHAPRVEHLQPVLLMRLDEAVGLNCDHLFIADVSADRYPGPAVASPYLPLEVQAAALVPGATPALQLEQAQRLAAHLLELAPDISLSVPEVDERGAELRPAPVFGAGEWQRADAPRAVCRQEQDSVQPPRLTLPADDPVPAVSASELAGLRADTRLFHLWFASPFFAFCRYRLGIERLPSPGVGLDARGQGEVLHGVLYDVWESLGDSAALAALNETELRQRIQASLERRLPQRMPAADYGAAQLRLEQARMADVLAQWLRHEQRRVDPFTVVLREARVETAVAGLPLVLRMDRVDRVQTPAGERWLVMDYKTGRQANPAGWNAEKMTEPQLPLYASHAVRDAAGIPRVDGICFGHLKDGHPALVARTNWRLRLIEPETRPDQDWDATLAAWRTALEAAAGGFLAGEASFDPQGAYRGPGEEFLALGGGLREEAA